MLDIQNSCMSKNVSILPDHLFNVCLVQKSKSKTSGFTKHCSRSKHLVLTAFPVFNTELFSVFFFLRRAILMGVKWGHFGSRSLRSFPMVLCRDCWDGGARHSAATESHLARPGRGLGAPL